ncbi:dihydrolipoyl dehydrogenase family protein [Streptomyces pinistramenti]|uniref:dihydrolipoyl dehydrogenase family protein n=1 Tax=Streptomyces pinistramenti TaxID=2884812 RepID=UPI001D066590|nr:NAD(P)/FAD-dependent oxidoreductase [Streptomyces pinistramenti]MCB5911037.1 NAD(P)/FAD-dependent oxidoreductase [Streptomyces pinistramenti]
MAASAATADETYDVIVLGAGPTGENVADRAHAAGLSAVVVESELVGGECSYWACMPSKALLRPVTARSEARRVPGLKDAVDGPLDAAAVLAHRDAFASHWKDEGQVRWLESAGIGLVRGKGRLAGPRRVVVDGRTLAARHAVAVCTGSRAVLPPVPGLAEAGPWTSREATSAGTVPGRLVIIGGGVVGVEMATAWRALGASVTLLVRGDGLLPRMEPFAGYLVAESLAEAGVLLRTGVEAREVRREAPGGAVTVVLDTGDEIIADEILIATGRAPRTDDIGLETVGLEPGSWLAVDDSCLVATPGGDGWLYGVGDVNHRALLTHQGKYQARIAGAAIVARAQGVPVLESDRWGAHAATADTAAVPQVVFSDPEAASVGLTAAEAERAGYRIRAVDQDLGAVAGASLYADGYRGRARMVVDLDREILLGATFVGPGVGELLHSATVAVAGEVPVERLWHAVPSYPTISEVWLRLLEAYRDTEGTA